VARALSLYNVNQLNHETLFKSIIGGHYDTKH